MSDSKRLLPATQLTRRLQAEHDESIDLVAIPSNRLEMTAIHPQVPLQEALETLDRAEVETLYVSRLVAPKTGRVLGIVLRQHIESAYQTRSSATI